MPHDIHGDELHVGDLVAAHFRITQIHLTEEFCNVTLETVEKMFPGDHKTTLTLNGKQVERVITGRPRVPA